ncbi:expressed protein [Phakopsora pachyrhizi]|uniref:Signal recognition particle subunit SRP68 n=1 Tax=Phakopsora pachyrhizi TaxID=170000 RepID=A0AAV0BMH9_PHAPC|nr:expressed protein [Phakopsora pachyrhizi]
MSSKKLNRKIPSVQSFYPLNIVTQERKLFGVRNFDFRKYHVHCTKKINNLRKQSGLQHVQRKYFDKCIFKTDEMSTGDVTIKHLMITLFEIERCWASFRESKDLIHVEMKKKQNFSSTESDSKNEKAQKSNLSRLRRHSHLRLSKAVTHSKVFLKLVELVHQSGQSLHQVNAYVLYLRGLLDFELGRWKQGLDHLSVSCVIMKALGSIKGQLPREKALFYEWIDDLSPLIRYCAYKSDITNIDVEKFTLDRVRENSLGNKLVKSWDEVEEFLESNADENRVELTWKGRSIPIRNSELVDLVSKVQAASKNLSTVFSDNMIEEDDSKKTKTISKKKDKRRKFLESKNPGSHQLSRQRFALRKALIIFTEAESLLQELVKANNRNLGLNNNAQAGLDQRGQLENLELVHGIVGFKLLSIRIQRDLDLVEKLNKKLSRNEDKVCRRISFSSKDNPYIKKNYQKLDILIQKQQNSLKSLKTQSDSSRVHRGFKTEEEKTRNIKQVLIKRLQSKIFPSLLKVYETLIYDLESMKNLKILILHSDDSNEDDEDLICRIDFLISFYQSHRFYVLSKVYFLVNKFKESYEIYLKSYYEYRKSITLHRLETLLDCLKSDILRSWFNQSDQSLSSSSKPSDSKASDHEKSFEDFANQKLRALKIKDPEEEVSGGLPSNMKDRLDKDDSKVFLDIVFNYLTDFNLSEFDSKPSSDMKRSGYSDVKITDKTSKTIISGSGANNKQKEEEEEDKVDEKPKSGFGGGFWNFFSRS